MKKLLPILFLLSAFSVFAQQKERSLAHLKRDTRIYWTKGDPSCCDEYYSDGINHRIIQANDLYISMFMDYIDEGKGYYVFNVFVGNLSDKRITVKPEEMSLEIWKKRDDITAEKAMEVLMPVSPQNVASAFRRQALWQNALSSASASMETRTAQIRNNQTGETVTVTTPNTEAQNQAARRSEENSKDTEDAITILNRLSFKANTIFPQGKVSGDVYFKHKKHQSGIFIVKIEGVEYAFMYSFADKPKN